MFLRMQKNVREWTFTLLSEFSFWELESWWTPKFSKGECRGQNILDWKVLYIIGKPLELRYLEWVRMTHLDIWNTSYGQKKGRKSYWQFDSQPLKVGNRPNFLACRWCATYRWRDLDKVYNFSLDLISIGGLHAKLWGPKVMGDLILGISRLPFGSLETKCHLDVGLMERHTVYYKGGKWWLPPKFGLWWVLWVRVCSWLVLAPKVFQLCTNQFVVLFCAGLCEWLKCLSIFLVPSRSSSTPLYPRSVAS